MGDHDDIPARSQPPGYVALFRGERPPNCMSVDVATDMFSGGSRGRWFTTDFSYARSHLSPNTAANFLKAAVGIPVVQKPLKHPEKYGDDAIWRIKALVIPREVARVFYVRNVFWPANDGPEWDGTGVLRRVEHPLVQRETKKLWRRAMRRYRQPSGIIYLLPRHVVDRATVLKQGGQHEVWSWAESFITRGRKPLPPDVVDVTLDELEMPEPQILERLDAVREPIPEAWKVRAVAQYPNVEPWAEALDGEDLEDVLELAREVSEALEKR